ncbi:MAG: Fic family protein [Oscillospiraceae bacterium]|jgi:cell filamentation protein|nr:Fic family protein [Oscillospiraceae bacterium]
MYIESGSEPTFEKLRQEDHFLIETTPELIPEKLAYYLGEINVIHPFRDGNGRTQRVFIQYLAHAAGYHVDFTDVTGSEMIEASAQAFDCDYRKLTELFQKITAPISEQEQEQFIKQILEKSSPILETFLQQRIIAEEGQTEEEAQHLIF